MRKIIGYTAIVLLYSCCHQIHDGKVIEKIYQPERTYVYLTPMICGKVTVMIPHTGYDDEDFILKVQGKKGDKVITEDFYVSEKDFNCLNTGDYFNDTIVPCSTEDPVKQIK